MRLSSLVRRLNASCQGIGFVQMRFIIPYAERDQDQLRLAAPSVKSKERFNHRPFSRRAAMDEIEEDE
jgi:hypothetical protein